MSIKSYELRFKEYEDSGTMAERLVNMRSMRNSCGMIVECESSCYVVSAKYKLHSVGWNESAEAPTSCELR